MLSTFIKLVVARTRQHNQPFTVIKFNLKNHLKTILDWKILRLSNFSVMQHPIFPIPHSHIFHTREIFLLIILINIFIFDFLERMPDGFISPSLLPNFSEER